MSSGVKIRDSGVELLDRDVRVNHVCLLRSEVAFRERFEAKGRMSSYLARIPTAVIVHPLPAFLGLAHLASVRARPRGHDRAW